MILRYLTAGESHGPALCGILEGMPAGVEITQQDFDLLSARRWTGYGRGARRSIEKDRVEVLSGIVGGLTIGSPIALTIKNSDYAAHKSQMAVFAAQRAKNRIAVPLPGHADLPGVIKYGFDDCRFVRERASARETAIRTALSVPARCLLNSLGINSLCLVESVGGIAAHVDYQSDLSEMATAIDHNADLFLTPDQSVCSKWQGLVDTCKEEKKSLGGTGAVVFWNLPAGLGSHVHYDRRLDSRLASLLMSLPGIKGVEIGLAKDLSCKAGGSTDSVYYSNKRGFYRTTNFAGGLEGGISNGEPLILRFHMKALPGGCSSESVNLDTFASASTENYRSDTLALSAAAVVAESVIAIELASQVLSLTGSSDFSVISRRFANL
jgi:chorismate synthase